MAKPERNRVLNKSAIFSVVKKVHGLFSSENFSVVLNSVKFTAISPFGEPTKNPAVIGGIFFFFLGYFFFFFFGSNLPNE